MLNSRTQRRKGARTQRDSFRFAGLGGFRPHPWASRGRKRNPPERPLPALSPAACPRMRQREALRPRLLLSVDLCAPAPRCPCVFAFCFFIHLIWLNNYACANDPDLGGYDHPTGFAGRRFANAEKAVGCFLMISLRMSIECGFKCKGGTSGSRLTKTSSGPYLVLVSLPCPPCRNSQFRRSYDRARPRASPKMPATGSPSIFGSSTPSSRVIVGANSRMDTLCLKAPGLMPGPAAINSPSGR